MCNALSSEMWEELTTQCLTHRPYKLEFSSKELSALRMSCKLKQEASSSRCGLVDKQRTTRETFLQARKRSPLMVDAVLKPGKHYYFLLRPIRPAASAQAVT